MFFNYLLEKLAEQAHGCPINDEFICVLGFQDGDALICTLTSDRCTPSPDFPKFPEIVGTIKGALVYGIKPMLGTEGNLQLLKQTLIDMSNVTRTIEIPDAPWNRDETRP